MSLPNNSSRLAPDLVKTNLEESHLLSSKLLAHWGLGKQSGKPITLALMFPSKKKAFSQLVAAVWGLHGAGFAHNDLHGNNIVFDKGNELALIDFGDVSPLTMGYTGAGLKRDANAVWRWGAALSGCHKHTYKYLKTPQSRRDGVKQNLLDCMKDAWGMDEKSLAALRTIIDTCAAQTPDQHIQELFQSPFVQKYLPALKKDFCMGRYEGLLQLGLVQD